MKSFCSDNDNNYCIIKYTNIELNFKNFKALCCNIKVLFIKRCVLFSKTKYEEIKVHQHIFYNYSLTILMNSYTGMMKLKIQKCSRNFWEFYIPLIYFFTFILQLTGQAMIHLVTFLLSCKQIFRRIWNWRRLMNQLFQTNLFSHLDCVLHTS